MGSFTDSTCHERFTRRLGQCMKAFLNRLVELLWPPPSVGGRRSGSGEKQEALRKLPADTILPLWAHKPDQCAKNQCSCPDWYCPTHPCRGGSVQHSPPHLALKCQPSYVLSIQAFPGSIFTRLLWPQMASTPADSVQVHHLYHSLLGVLSKEMLPVSHHTISKAQRSQTCPGSPETKQSPPPPSCVRGGCQGRLVVGPTPSMRWKVLYHAWIPFYCNWRSFCFRSGIPRKLEWSPKRHPFRHLPLYSVRPVRIGGPRNHAYIPKRQSFGSNTTF